MDPGPVWQGSAEWEQHQVFEDEQVGEQPTMIGPRGQKERVPATSVSFLPENTSDQDETFVEEEILPFKERFRQVLQDFAFILVPLLLGIFTCMLVLPWVARGGMSAPPNSLLIILCVVVVIVVAQGIASYFSGTNSNMWTLSILGGFCSLLLTGVFALFGLAASLTLFLGLVVLAIAAARFYVHTVNEGTVDISYAFGKYYRTLYPGLNILYPWEQVKKPVKVTEVQWLCPLQRVQMSPKEDVHLRATVSYQLMPQDAHLAITQVQNWEESLREYFLASLQEIATALTPEDFIAWPQGLQTPPSELEQAGSLARREVMNRHLFSRMQNHVAMWGVEIRQITVRDVVLAPHEAKVVDIVPPITTMPESPSTPPLAREATSAPVAAAQPVQQRPAAMTPVSLPQVANSPKSEGPGFMPNGHASQVAPVKRLNEEVLKKVYKEVQDGKITDPETIREIAGRFQSIADDEQASQLVSFDAARAALNLYDQARKYEDRGRG
jgi:hypothetical protein